MRKFVLLGLLVALSTGCGRGWLPLFRGAPCYGTCGVPALPAALNTEAGCAGCGSTAASYGSYESEVPSGSYYGGETVVGDGYTGSGTIIDNGYNGVITSPMSPLPAK